MACNRNTRVYQEPQTGSGWVCYPRTIRINAICPSSRDSSSLQFALLVMPVLVFASLLVAQEPLDLHFTLLELLAVGASVLVVHLVASDGQSHWMEGVLLLAVYLILAMGFYHLPAPRTPT